MSLTLCIVLYNEEKHLGLVHKNLELLRSHKQPMQVILVNNGSTDKTGFYLQQWQKNFAYQLLERATNNLGEARANCISQAQSEWVAFIDADCLLSADWLSQVFQQIIIAKPNVVALGGPWLAGGKEVYADLFKTFLGNFGLPHLKPHRESEPIFVQHLPTANVIYRKQRVLSVGNFATEILRVGEDLDLSRRMLQDGGQLVLLPSLKIIHVFDGTLAKWFAKIVSYGTTRIRVGGYRKLFGEYLYSLPLLFILFCAMNLILLRQLYFIPALLYLLFCSAFIISSGVRGHRFVNTLLFMTATHFAYGWGMWKGLLSLLLIDVKKHVLTFRPERKSKALADVL